MALKIVVFYNQPNRGWTETYYSQSTTDPYTYAANLSNVTMQPFVGFRSYVTTIPAIRVSTVGVSRQSFTAVYQTGQIPTGLANNTISAASAGPDMATTDAYCQFLTTNYHKRPVYIRGLNDFDTLRNGTGVDSLGPTAYNGILGMLAQIKALGWCIQSQNRPPNSGLAWVYPTLVTYLGDLTNLSIPSQIAALTIPGGQVVFQGIPYDDMPGFPKIATPTYQSATSPYYLQIPYRLRISGTAGTYVPGKLRVCAVSYTYYPITSVAFIHFAERKTGRPFGLLRGRTRPKVRAL